MPTSRISRRTFTKIMAGVVPAGRAMAATVTSDLEWRRQRQKLAQRRRRIIYNDDGDSRYLPGPPKDVADFLSRRFDWTKGTQVDSYYWCIGNGEEPPWGKPEPETVGDGTRVMLDAARAAGQEAVISLRMNDIHDAFMGVTYPFKLQHRDMLIEPSGAKGKYPMTDWRFWYWSAMDYAHPEVREHKFGYISRICEKYVPDALELDFMRHPMFFKKGEGAANLPVMTEFVRRIRQRLDEIGRQRGRPILLAVRLADTPERSVKLGLDGFTWLKEGLLDVLITGLGMAPYGDSWKQFAELARKYEVPAYPCYECALLAHMPQIELLRGAAMNWLNQGAPGIYLFNPFVPPDMKKIPAETMYREFKRLGSAETLKGLDKVYCPDYFSPSVDPPQFTWTLEASAERVLPAKISRAAKVFPVRLEEDLGADLKAGECKLALRLLTSDSEAAGQLVVKWLGVILRDGKPAGEGWIEFPIHSQGHGLHEVSVALRGETTLKLLQLWVRYSEA